MIKVYSQPNCVHCARVKRWLDENEVEFQDINVQEDEEALAKVRKWGFQQVPVVKIGGLKTLNPSNQELENIVHGRETSVFDY